MIECHEKLYGSHPTTQNLNKKFPSSKLMLQRHDLESELQISNYNFLGIMHYFPID
jgi:hypothetical protein